MLELSGQENMVMASMGRLNRSGFVAWPRIRHIAQDLTERLRFQGRIKAPARTNSGGNQQELAKRRHERGAAHIAREPQATSTSSRT